MGCRRCSCSTWWGICCCPGRVEHVAGFGGFRCRARKRVRPALHASARHPDLRSLRRPRLSPAGIRRTRRRSPPWSKARRDPRRDFHGVRALPDGVRSRVPVRAARAHHRLRPAQGQSRRAGRTALFEGRLAARRGLLALLPRHQPRSIHRAAHLRNAGRAVRLALRVHRRRLRHADRPRHLPLRQAALASRQCEAAFRRSASH